MHSRRPMPELDSLIVHFDRALRTVAGVQRAQRASPAAGLAAGAPDPAARGGRAGLVNPLWYAGAFALGAAAGALGDRWSLAFVAETERQVEAHLSGHLDRLSPEDRKTRAGVEAVR